MRNCFVPWCDFQSPANRKRMMFLPPRDNELFEKWKDVLPKKRPFKKTDKICERHFNPSDISTTFDHVINGELFQMERGKPKLKPNVIPCKNIPKMDEIEAMRRGRKVGKYVAAKKQRSTIIKSDIIIPVRKCKTTAKKKDTEIVEYLEEDILQHSDIIIETTLNELVCPIVTTNTIKPAQLPNNNDHKNINISENFENIYEDIFEVVLPNTLWGIHRDPDKNFIAFSYYDPKIRTTNRIVEISNQLVVKVILSNKVLTEYVYLNIEHENITKLLCDTDSLRICSLQFAENCLIKITEPNRELCENCLILDIS